MTKYSALYVDFDNVYITLQNSDKAAARYFAEKPLEWLSWFELGDHDQQSEEPAKRRVLIRRCYLNPDRFGHFRKFFTYSGFQTIDCPSLTGQGKNSADIYMVLDIVEALGHSTQFDEFIILSADADFTPVLLKLREYQKDTSVLSTAVTSSALRNAADNTFELDEFIEDALGGGGLAYKPQKAVAPIRRIEDHEAEIAHVAKELTRRVARSGEVASDQIAKLILSFYPAFKDSSWLGKGTFNAMIDALIAEGTGLARDDRNGTVVITTTAVPEDVGSADDELPADAEKILDFIEAELAESDSPVRGSAIGMRIVRKFGQGVKEGNWFGHGSLSSLLQASGRAGIATSPKAGGLIYQPGRHDPDGVASAEESVVLHDVPEDLREFIEQLATVGWPRLNPKQLELIISHTAKMIGEGITERNPLSAAVRDAMDEEVANGTLERGEGVSRSNINFILTGLLIQGLVFGETCNTEGDIREGMKSTILSLVENRLHQPTEEEVQFTERMLGLQ